MANFFQLNRQQIFNLIILACLRSEPIQNLGLFLANITLQLRLVALDNFPAFVANIFTFLGLRQFLA